MIRRFVASSLPLAFLLSLLPIFAFGQARLSLHTGANFPGSTIPFGEKLGLGEPLPSYWFEPGLTLGASLELPVLPWLSIAPVFEYNHYFFDKTLNLEFPQSKEPSAEPSRVFRVAIEARILREAKNHNRFYVATGVGYMVEKIGLITISYYGETEKWDFLPALGRNYWAHSLGVGYQFAFSRKLGLDLCAKYYSNYTDRCDVSTNIGVVYAFEM